ncbi:MAG: substrate-binding domain-containing protein [Thermoguttaceae bacterium]
MTTRSRLLLSLALACVLPGSVGADEPLKLIFITPCREEAFFGPVKKGMQDAAAMLGVECSFTGTVEVDVKAQAEMVRKAVADGYDGIALNIIDPVAFDEVVREAAGKGVPVVAFNVDDQSTDNARLAAVCQDFYRAGRTVGARAGEFIAPGSKVLVTLHNEGISALDDRARGIQDSLKDKNLAWKVIVSGNDPQTAVETIADQLRADPEIKAVLCTGLTDTEAAGTSAEKHFTGRDLVIAGFDLTPNILGMVDRGVIKFTIDQQPYTQGFYPVVQLTLYCRYGIQPSSIDAGAGIVTQKDARRVIELTAKKFR